MKSRYIILSVILILAGFFRLYHLTSLPPALFSDEVDAGYQAMVFNQNHTDYFGNKFPVHFHSFSDWRTSLQIYSIALVQHFTHNPDLSVRLPSAVFGIASIAVIFLITQSLIPALLLAVSPWAIHYSRTGFEVAGMILVLLLGIYFWQKYLQNSRFRNILLSVFFFCLSPYFYSTAKFFLFILAPLILVIWWPQIKKIEFKKIVLTIIFGFILLLPMGIDTFAGRAGFRFSYISIFTMPHREQITDNLRYQDVLLDHPGQIGLKTPLISYILHNKYQIVARTFISNYVSSFSSVFLFLQGDSNPRQGFGGGAGLLYLIDFPLILIGLFSLFKHKTKDKLSLLFFWILIFAPIPFALTRDSDSPHATRLILMLPSLIYFSYLGIVFLKSKFKYSYLIIFSLLFISVFSFWHYYQYHYPEDSARYWHAGMKQAVIASNLYPNSTIVFSDSFEPFLPFFLFYHPYQLTPGSSISTHLIPTNNNSFSGQTLDSHFLFGHINWSNLSSFPPNSIFVLPKSEYDNLKTGQFTQIQFIPKQYVNQESFILVQSNEK